jgi:hypothetical protein
MDPVKEKLNLLKKLALEKKLENEKNRLKHQQSENIEDNNDSKELVEIKNESNIQLPAKQPYKNFTIVQYPDPSSSKYINKLKDLYNNKEWRLSSDSINVNIRNKQQNYNNNDDDNSSSRNSIYIKKLVNNYQSPKTISNSFENLKTNNNESAALAINNQIKTSNNQINRLKERLAKRADISSFVNKELVETSFKNSEKICAKKLEEPAVVVVDEKNNDISSSANNSQRPKYQKSKTTDLSDFISWDQNEIDLAAKVSNSPVESDTKSSIDSIKIHSDPIVNSSQKKGVFVTKSILKIPSTVIEKSIGNSINNFDKMQEMERADWKVMPQECENKNRNRFKKKVTVRSHSAEIIDFKHFDNELNDDKFDNFSVDKPILKRQDAVKTKSYAENLHYLHKEHDQQRFRQPRIVVRSNHSSLSSLSSLSDSICSSASTLSSDLSHSDTNCEKCNLKDKKKKRKSSKKDYCKKCDTKRRSHSHKHKKNHHHHHHSHHHSKKDSFTNMIDSIKTSLNDFNDFYTSKNKPNNMQPYYSSDDSICGIPKVIPK